MSPRLSRITAKELIRFLKNNGFVHYDTKGSHQHFMNPATNQKTRLPGEELLWWNVIIMNEPSFKTQERKALDLFAQKLKGLFGQIEVHLQSSGY